LRITHINEEAERLLHADAGVLVGRELGTILDPLASDLIPEITEARKTGESRSRLMYFGAAQWWIDVRIKPGANETVISLRDVTLQTVAERRLLESESRLRMLMGQVPAILWSVDRLGRFVSLSGAGLTALNLRESEMVGRDSAAFLGTRSGASSLDSVFGGSPLQFESAVGASWLRHLVEPLRGPDGVVIGAVGASVDITELRRSRDELEIAASHDALTGLPNRVALEAAISELLNREREKLSAVLFIDLDRFKTINDTFGHRTGDRVLTVVAGRLCASLDSNDIVARQGGDEFIVVLRSVRSPDEIAGVAARLLRRLREPIILDGRQLFVSGSIGVAIAPQHGSSPEELIKNADAAMYRAKAAGASAVMFYDGVMEADMRKRVTLEGDLRDAIQRRQFRLLYQPIVDVASGRIMACEALARWLHPVRGLLLPDAFIGIAEETGLIHELTAWVLAEACRFGASVRRERPDFRVTVNLSPSDLRENDIVAVIREELSRAELEPAGLEIEVTENVLLEDTALVALNALRALGVQIAIDDFGIAYNSLLHVKRLPLTTIKIDRLFVRDLAHDRFDQAIVRTIGTLGRSLGLRVVAEGVETDTQWDFIREIGCEEVQGYRFSRPVEPLAFEQMMSRTY